MMRAFEVVRSPARRVPMTRTTAARQRGFNALIVGGGVAGLEAMLALRALAPDLVDVELVSAERHSTTVRSPLRSPSASAKCAAGSSAISLAPPGLIFLSASSPPWTRTAGGAPPSGAVIEYDALLVASGARAEQAVEGALASAGRRTPSRFAPPRRAREPRDSTAPLAVPIRARVAAADLRARAAERPGGRRTDVDVRVGLVDL